MIRKYSRLLLYACGVPAFSFVVLWAVQWHQERDWMAAVKADFPQSSEADLQTKSLVSLCRLPGTRDALGEICVSYERVKSLRALATVTIGVTLLLLLVIHWVGQRCRRDRQLLLRCFRAGSYLVTAVTLVLVISQAVLLASTLYYGPSEFLNRIPSGLILAIGIGALIAVYRVVRLLVAFNKEIVLEVGGEFLSADQAPTLWKFVEQIAQEVGTETPGHIVAGADATFFVTEAKVSVTGGVASGRTLYVSIPLCHILTKNELRAVIGHEMAHFHGRDTEFSRRFYPVFRNGSNTLEAIVGTAQSVGGGAYALLPAIWLLSHYLSSFSEAEAEISRERELAADMVGAKVTSPRDFALAITKIIEHDSAWEQTCSNLLESPASDKVALPLPSEVFVEIAERQVRETSRTAQVEQLEKEQLAHPTDSHPPLSVRLRALGFTVDELFEAAAELRPADPSITLIPAAEELERKLLPDFCPKSDQTQTIFCRRQAGFAAMEYYGLILNRSFVVYVSPEGLYGLKFCGWVSSDAGSYFESALDVLDDPYFMPGTDAFRNAMNDARGSFFIPHENIMEVEFDGSPKWGMGRIAHAGKLRLRLRNGKRRELILLGNAYGDGIMRVISEMYNIPSKVHV